MYLTNTAVAAALAGDPRCWANRPSSSVSDRSINRAAAFVGLFLGIAIVVAARSATACSAILLRSETLGLRLSRLECRDSSPCGSTVEAALPSEALLTSDFASVTLHSYDKDKSLLHFDECSAPWFDYRFSASFKRLTEYAPDPAVACLFQEIERAELAGRHARPVFIRPGVYRFESATGEEARLLAGATLIVPPARDAILLRLGPRDFAVEALYVVESTSNSPALSELCPDPSQYPNAPSGCRSCATVGAAVKPVHGETVPFLCIWLALLWMRRRARQSDAQLPNERLHQS